MVCQETSRARGPSGICLERCSISFAWCWGVGGGGGGGMDLALPGTPTSQETNKRLPFEKALAGKKLLKPTDPSPTT